MFVQMTRCFVSQTVREALIGELTWVLKTALARTVFPRLQCMAQHFTWAVLESGVAADSELSFGNGIAALEDLYSFNPSLGI